MDIDITGIKLNYSSEKKNDYGTNHFFQVLDESPLKKIIELGKDMRTPVWEYGQKHYLKTSGNKLVQYSVDRFNGDEKNGIEEITFKKICLTLWVSHLQNMI